MNDKQATDPAQQANKQEDLSSIHYASSLVSGPEHEIDISDETYEDALFSSEEELDEHLAAPGLADATAAEEPSTPASPDAEPAPAYNDEPLFASDEALDQALANAEATKQQQEAANRSGPANQSGSTEQPDTNQQPSAGITPPVSADKPVRIDLAIFHPNPNRVCPEAADFLSIAEEGFNRYPTAAKMSIGSAPAKLTDITSVAIPEPQESDDEAPTVDQNENKFADKAKRFYSGQKAKFDEYFGRSLPQRTLDLEFHFTSLKTKKDFDYIVRGIDIEKAFKTKGKQPESLFKLADENLLNLSKCKMSHGNRLRLLNTYCGHLIPLYEFVMQQQYRKPNASSDEKRTAIADHACNALKHLITGYKQIYCDFYNAPNYVYGPQRNSANEIAYKLIDLIVFEQRVHAALQKPLQRTSIPTINNLYIALRSYEPDVLQTPGESIALNRQASINELFCRYQTLLTFDLLSISATLQPALYDYLQEQQHHMQIVEPANYAELHEAVLIVQYQQVDVPAYATKFSSESIAPVFIKVKSLFEQLRNDLTEYEKALGKIAPIDHCQSLKTVSNLDAVSLLSTMQHAIDITEKHIKPKVYEVYRPQKIQVCGGFVQCVKYLEYHHALNKNQTLEKDEAETELPAKVELDKGKWACAAEENGFSYLQAHTKLALDVGDTILLNNSNTESESLRVARVLRVERAEKAKTNLIVEFLADQLTVVKVTRANNKLTPAILAKQDDQLKLILSADEPIHNGQRLKIKFADGQKVEFAVKAIFGGSRKTQTLAVV